MKPETRERITRAALCSYREECLAEANKIDAADPSYIRRFNRASRLQRAALADEALKPGGTFTGGQEMADAYQRLMDMIAPKVAAEEDEQERRNDGLAHDDFCENAYGEQE